MADGGIKQFTEEMEQAGREVVKEVKDSVGEMIEQAVQTTPTPQLTAQQVQSFDSAQDKQKQQEDQKQLAETRRKMKWYKDIEEAQRKVREEQKQKELQRLQADENKKQEKKIILIEQKQQKQKILAPTPMSSIENKSKFSSLPPKFTESNFILCKSVKLSKYRTSPKPFIP